MTDPPGGWDSFTKEEAAGALSARFSQNSRSSNDSVKHGMLKSDVQVDNQPLGPMQEKM